MFEWVSISEAEDSQDKTWPRLPQRYELKEKLGGAGGGSVYLAYDKHLGRLVAIKTPKGAVLGKVANEAVSQAQLVHSNIPQVYDTGDSVDHRVYISMEYVEGENILSYCCTQGTPVRERVRFLREICSAVHYVHSRPHHASVHRDIRIANVMITRESGISKLTDFGMASRIDHVREVFVTSGGGVSENWFERGVEVDLYSTGILAWQLLTGCPRSGNAHRRDCQDADEVESMHRDLLGLIDEGGISHEFAHSTGLTQKALQRQLQGDLGYILTKSIGQGEGQYSTAEELGDDLRCYLERYPLTSKPTDWRDVCVRFVERNPILAGVAPTLTLAFCIVGAFYLFTYDNLISTRSDLVSTREDLSTTLDDLGQSEHREDRSNSQLAEVYEATNPARPSESVTRVPRSMLDMLSSATGVLSLGNAPFSDSEIRKTMARVDSQSANGLHAEAEAEWEQLYLGQIRQHGAESLEVLWPRILFAAAKLKRGKGEEALELTKLNTRILEQHGVPLSSALWLWNAHVMAATQQYGGHYDVASDIEGQVLKRNDNRRNELWADASHTLALAQLGMGNATDALQIVSEVVDFYRAEIGEYSVQTLQATKTQVRIFEELGRPDDAVGVARQLVAQFEEIYPDGGPQLSKALLLLGKALGRAEELDEAVEKLENVVERESNRELRLDAMVELRGIDIMHGRRLSEARSELSHLIDDIETELRSDTPVLIYAKQYKKLADEKLRVLNAEQF